jgi:phage terminase large subunit-like protein
MVDNIVREVASFYEENLFEFAKYINPDYMYGDIHERVFMWLQQNTPESAKQLLLLPRGHLKSHCIAVWTVWNITRKPWASVIYVSAGEELAKAQVYAIKNMLTCDRYRLLWPEMINEEEAKRDKWTAWAINVDHPLRKERGTRDHTLLERTVKSNATGLHCSDLVFDDVVVPGNAYSPAGRSEVRGAISQFASILNPGGTIKAVGTRYHPKDIYGQFEVAKTRVYEETTGELIGEFLVWQVMEEAVEDCGDMSGLYLWPKTRNPKTGEWYGFDINTLAEIKAQYESVGELTQFYAQYYNNPNDPDSNRLSYNDFTYYDRKFLKEERGVWYFKDQPLAIFAAMDIAWTTGESSDYTAIAVVGLDADGFYYVLDLDRFKTQDYEVFYEKVRTLHDYWGFKKIRVETNSGGKLVANQLETYSRQEGRSLIIDTAYTSSNVGKKAERHGSVLEWRYKKKYIRHFKGGLIPDLEDEIVMARPAHDDLEDALCAAVEIAKPPSARALRANKRERNNIVIASDRFGGRRIGR